MSNSKSDQTVTNWCVVTPRSNKVTSQSQTSKKSHPKGQGSFTISKDHFYPKTKFQEEVNYRKKNLNECSKANRKANNFYQVLHALISSDY